MHSYVNAALQQRVVNLLCEQALAANVCQGLVQNLVAGRFDNAYLERALLMQLREGRLGTQAPQTYVRVGQAQVQDSASRARTHLQQVSGHVRLRQRQWAAPSSNPHCGFLYIMLLHLHSCGGIHPRMPPAAPMQGCSGSPARRS